MVHKIKKNPIWYAFGGIHNGKEIVYVSKGKGDFSAIDVADSYHKEKYKEKRNYGLTYEKPKQFQFDKPLKFVKIPKSFKPKLARRDFIDRMIAYESGELPPEKEIKFLKEVERKGLAGKLQGHYGRAIKRMREM